MRDFVLFVVPAIWTLWALVVWFSPCVFLPGAHRITVNSWMLPAWFILQCRDYGIEVYTAENLPVGGEQGYAMACFIGARPCIFVNSAFLQFAVPAARDFVLAHELGHHHFGHPALRAGCRALFLDRIPAVRRRLQLTEQAADDFAEQLTGHPPSVVWGPTVIPASEPRRGQPTEETER